MFLKVKLVVFIFLKNVFGAQEILPVTSAVNQTFVSLTIVLCTNTMLFAVFMCMSVVWF